MISNTEFRISLHAAKASRSYSDIDSSCIVYHQDFRELVNAFVSQDNTSVFGSQVSSSLPPKKRIRSDRCANNELSCNTCHQDCREHINGFVSPDSTSVADSNVSSSLPPKKRRRLQVLLCQSRTALVSPNDRPLYGSLCKRYDSIDTGYLTVPLETSSSNRRSAKNYYVSESSHFVQSDPQLNVAITSIDRKAKAPTTKEQKNETSVSSEDVFGNSIQMGYFSSVNIMISPEKLLQGLKNASGHSNDSLAKKEKVKPYDQDILGNAIGMGYFSTSF